MSFDTHAHLDQPEFDEDRDAVVQRAREAGVSSMLAVATTLQSSLDTLQLAAQYEGVYAAVGIHPNNAAQARPGDWDRVRQLIGQPRVLALGETGLDRYWDYTPFEVQQDYFDRHLRLSQETGLPVVIHSRDCDADILAMLRDARQRGPLRGIMHSFCGSAETAVQCLELGLHISFAGMVTYKKNNALRAIARTIPSDRLLVETDSPYLTPEPVRKIRRNEPAHVVHTVRCLAETRGVSVKDLDEQTTRNAQRLFSIGGHH